jgi:hypothetical protein
MRLFVLSLVAISFLTISSCSKYSDGPSISFTSRKARLCNDWILESYFRNETDKTDESQTVKLVFEKDGTYSKSTVAVYTGQVQGFYENGTWVFEDNKGQILLYNGVDEEPIHVYTIYELRRKRLKLVETFSSIGVTNTYQFVVF